jgi:hypothetical protein
MIRAVVALSYPLIVPRGAKCYRHRNGFQCTVNSVIDSVR